MFGRGHGSIPLPTDTLIAVNTFDASNKGAVQKAIGELIRHKTVIMIAHHPKTIEHVDQILVVNEGRIEAMSIHHNTVSPALQLCTIRSSLYLT